VGRAIAYVEVNCLIEVIFLAIPRIYKTEAIVLRQNSLGEADRIVTLYTPLNGKVRAVARGVRRPKSKLSGHLELLNRVKVSLARGRNLDIVSEAEVVKGYRQIRSDLNRITKAIYMAELVDNFSVENAPNQPLFDLALEFMEWLSGDANSDILLRYFEARLLDVTGYKPEIVQCVECRTLLAETDHLFAAGSGGVLCSECKTQAIGTLLPITVNAMKILRFFLKQRAYNGVHRLTVKSQFITELERLHGVYIRYLLEKDLKSSEFMTMVAASSSKI